MEPIDLPNGWTLTPHPVFRGFRYGSCGDRTGSVGVEIDWVEGEDIFKVVATTEVLASERDDDDAVLNGEGYLLLANRLEILAAELRYFVAEEVRADIARVPINTAD